MIVGHLKSNPDITLLALSREPQHLSVETDIFGEKKFTSFVCPLSLTYILDPSLPKHEKHFEELLSLLDASILPYQSLFLQASLNSDKVQSALILDASLPDSHVALQLLHSLKIKTLAYTLDQFEMQKPLNDEFPQAFMIFTPVDKMVQRAKEVTRGAGFDVIVDYGGEVGEQKRGVIRMLGPFGRVITTARDLQIDPPESEILQELSATIQYTSKETLFKSHTHDAVLLNIISDVVQKHSQGALRVYKPYAIKL
ncbi:hypothetical protein FGO68_gene4905 [Halteria grandinella]|uniref:Uncharacterized protein n=1 Tax=Halteria grandinella TaxID=5974 RepID=A0A8J8P0W4_HALGN|nr:hypothetical protein FGO68_gene4905 [Halteria grandinella]